MSRISKNRLADGSAEMLYPSLCGSVELGIVQVDILGNDVTSSVSDGADNNPNSAIQDDFGPHGPLWKLLGDSLPLRVWREAVLP
jgi:hypothetical protein